MTKEQFFKEVLTLRELFGTKTFWANPQKVQLARKAINMSYLSVVDADEDVDKIVVDIYMTTMREFLHRAILMGVEL